MIQALQCVFQEVDNFPPKVPAQVAPNLGLLSLQKVAFNGPRLQQTRCDLIDPRHETYFSPTDINSMSPPALNWVVTNGLEFLLKSIIAREME
eukprot:23629-Pelagomonas_calceolata.AAC.2